VTKPKQSERSIQKAILAWLRSNDFLVMKLTTMGRYGTAGWPDLMVLDKAPRLPLFLEVKTEFGKLTPLQEQRIEALRKRGYPVFVVRSVPQTKLVVDAWLEFRTGVKK